MSGLRWRPPGRRAGCLPVPDAPDRFSLLLDARATITEVAELTGDDPATLYRHYSHGVPDVVSVAARAHAGHPWLPGWLP
jgi:hypothetical protein